MTKARSADERFDAKWELDAASGCHLWVGAKLYGGHGVFWLNGKNVGAHVFAYVRKFGAVPSGMHLDHFACDNPSCCNPDHVRPVTPRENTYRGSGPSSLNLAKTHCPKGHAYDAENTYVIKKTGFRQCRECKRLQAYARYVQNNPSSRRRGPYRTKRSVIADS